MTTSTLPKSIEWVGGLDGYVAMIDQTLLPQQTRLIECRDVETMWDAIKRLCIRGAPAIGIAAAMGVVLGVRDCSEGDLASLRMKVGSVCDYLATSRPTAVNLFWALNTMRKCADAAAVEGVDDLKQKLWQQALGIRDDDARMCRAIGEAGEHLIQPGQGILTYCNAGALATAELGTALAPMYVAYENGRRFQVYVPETRPLLQGARLTTYELSNAGIDVTLLCDGMVGSLMQAGRVQLVITGADRIAANGDTANKIGTYSVAVLAREHGIPFYVAAPGTTFDLSLADGSGIAIEERSAEEVTHYRGKPVAPETIKCYCPAFDVTPARLITGLITDRGVIEPVTCEKITRMWA